MSLFVNLLTIHIIIARVSSVCYFESLPVLLLLLLLQSLEQIKDLRLIVTSNNLALVPVHNLSSLSVRTLFFLHFLKHI